MDVNLNIQKPVVDELQLIVDNDLCCACGQSGVGGRKENQDTYGGVGNIDIVILTVCDGMGGMAGGQTASNIAVREIIKFLSVIPADKICIEDVKESVVCANEAIYKHAVEVPQLRGMGTTATVVVITKKAAYVAHVGDSRIYLIRKGKKVFRTFDHSKVFEMVQQGMMTEEQARQSSFSNIITRALGIRPTVDVEVNTIPYNKGDRFILCCDGIWNTDAEPDMLKLFVSKGTTQEVVNNITKVVNNKGIERGCEHDNLTIIMADMKENSDFQYGIFHNTLERISSHCKIFKRKNGKKN
ncbi:PP2C family protein-serine/threonine phosphatase [Sodaliphilus sp.]|uniref:PP2C family protein-serine/threonine phosphatase n=1 Tax=Sodaliphilus sp. TaxID=2815818 RepID=UPI00388E1FB7